jgi:AcrR family transcriptional regulator
MTGMTDVRPSLRDRKKDATRQLIEDVAWDLFTTQGFDETTVQQIADRANVAPRTFFRYFPSKEAVLYPELDGFMATMREAFRARPADEPALVALINAMDTVNEQLMHDAGRQFERHEMLKRTGAGITNGFVHDRIATAVADMIRERFDGEPDVEVRAQLTAGLVSTVMTISTEQWLTKGGTGEVDDEARQCFDILRSLIGT